MVFDAGANGKNYEDAHRFVLKQGLYVPPTQVFMPHVSNVINAHNKKVQLYDGEGNVVAQDEAEEMYKHLTTNYKAVYGAGTSAGAWSWLNGRFVQGKGFNGMDLEMIVGLNPDGTFTKRTIPLSAHLDEGGVYVDLAWAQGLPTQKSASQSYEQGRNIRFWKPIINRVAGFFADSVGAGLGCGGLPAGAGSSLGVFASAPLGARSAR